MNRHQALARLSVWLFAISALFVGGAAVLLYRVPTSDVVVCTRADGHCLIRHRTTLRSRSGELPLSTVTGATLREVQPGAARLELWLVATSGEYWVSDFVNWQRPVAEGLRAEILGFLSNPAAPRLESRHDFNGGPISALVMLILGMLSLFIALRLRIPASATTSSPQE
ncbi:MAG: hypothetical protein WCL36_06710 [bacterium]